MSKTRETKPDLSLTEQKSVTEKKSFPRLIGLKPDVYAKLWKNAVAEGAYSRVTKSIIATKPYAIKMFKYKNNPVSALPENGLADYGQTCEYVKEETDFLAIFKGSQVILQVEGYCLKPGPCIFTEWMEAPLSELICKPTKDNSAAFLSSMARLDLAGDICQGLIELEEKEVAHNDLKPPNMLYSNGKIKIADFGLASYYGVAISPCGTPGYIAPEFDEGGQPGVKTDTYSCGISFSVLFCATDENWEDVNIIQNKRPSIAISDTKPGYSGDLYTPGFYKLLKSCVDKDPAKRPHPKVILKSIQAEILFWTPKATEPAAAEEISQLTKGLAKSNI